MDIEHAIVSLGTWSIVAGLVVGAVLALRRSRRMIALCVSLAIASSVWMSWITVSPRWLPQNGLFYASQPSMGAWLEGLNDRSLLLVAALTSFAITCLAALLSFSITLLVARTIRRAPQTPSGEHVQT